MSEDYDSGSDGYEGSGSSETSRQGWIERMGKAFAGILIGLILIPVALVVMFWNEGRAVQTANSLVGSSRVDLQACKLEYSIVSPK